MVMELLFQNTHFIKEKSSTEKRKILVYDTSRGIAADIRKKLADVYEISSCLKKGDDLNVNLEHYFAAIIIINDIDDLMKIEQYRLKISNIIVSSSLKKDYFNFLNLNNLFFFELNLTRKSTISLIKEKLTYLDFHSN